MTRKHNTEILDQLRNYSITDSQLLEFIINDYLESSRVEQILIAAREEFLGDIDEHIGSE